MKKVFREASDHPSHQMHAWAYHQELVSPVPGAPEVVQGKNDPRVNIRESNQIVAAVRDDGKPVEYLVAPDKGRGFARPTNNLAMETAIEEFLLKDLGGRYQKDYPADVEAKLKKITVDPKTVSGAVTLKGCWRRTRSKVCWN